MKTNKTPVFLNILLNPVIMEILDSEGTSKYMFNDFHPNTPDGVGLFSYAVLQQEHLRRTGN